MQKKTRLINFHVPKELKDQFDTYCAVLDTSRTRVLKDMIECFIIKNADEVTNRIKKQKQLSEMASRLPKVKRFREFCLLGQEFSAEENYEPPEFFVSTYGS